MCQKNILVGHLKNKITKLEYNSPKIPHKYLIFV